MLTRVYGRVRVGEWGPLVQCPLCICEQCYLQSYEAGQGGCLLPLSFFLLL